MNTTYAKYRHSGRFGLHGVPLILLGATAVGWPAGFAYAYLIKWIPFIYLNFLLTAGYGCVFGLLAGLILKFAKVRNNGLAALSGLITGAIALYLAWNGHVHALFKGVSALNPPEAVWAGIAFLYDKGSWGLHSGDTVTGIVLAIVWVVEGAAIIGLSTIVPFGMISETPFCETARCWLDDEKKMSTLDAFTDPAQLAAFAAGDLAPLSQAKPRTPESPLFARLTLKHSPRCEEFCTVSLENVTIVRDRQGNSSEKKQLLLDRLILPKSMLELISKFESFGEAQLEPAPKG